MRFHIVHLAVTCVLSLGCSSETVEDKGTSEGGDSIPSETIEYYEGTSEGMAGMYAFEGHDVARRTLQRESSSIVERFYDLVDGNIYEVQMDIDLETQTFTLAFTDGSYEGTGQLYGDAWDWHAWESVSVAPNGDTVVSEDTKDDSGIVATKICTGADGQEKWRMEEVLVPISETEWLDFEEEWQALQ